MRRQARQPQSRRGPGRQAVPVLLAAILALAALAPAASAGSSAAGEYQLHIPRGAHIPPAHPQVGAGPQASGWSTAAVVVLVAGIAICAAGAGAVAYRGRREGEAGA